MLENLSLPTKEHLCVVGEKASELSKEDLAILEKALADPRWSSNALSDALRDLGFIVGKTTIARHRAKKCACSNN